MKAPVLFPSAISAYSVKSYPKLGNIPDSIFVKKQDASRRASEAYEAFIEKGYEEDLNDYEYYMERYRKYSNYYSNYVENTMANSSSMFSLGLYKNVIDFSLLPPEEDYCEDLPY